MLRTRGFRQHSRGRERPVSSRLERNRNRTGRARRQTCPARGPHRERWIARDGHGADPDRRASAVGHGHALAGIISDCVAGEG
jgi:hypothetical protein